MIRTALILFTKSPRHPEAKTRLRQVYSQGDVTDLHSAMVQDSVSLVKSSGADFKAIFWLTHQAETPPNIEGVQSYLQRGNTFTERFTHAIHTSFSLGTRGVVIIGSDCPGLTSELVESAIDFTSQGFLAVGPSSRGGFYLLGIPSTLCYAPIARIFEMEDQVAQMMQLFGEEKMRPLPFLPDLDLPEDLETIYQLLSLSTAGSEVRGSRLMQARRSY